MIAKLGASFTGDFYTDCEEARILESMFQFGKFLKVLISPKRPEKHESVFIRCLGKPLDSHAFRRPGRIELFEVDCFFDRDTAFPSAAYKIRFRCESVNIPET